MADEKVGSANVLIPATEEWTKFTGEFSYATDEAPEVQYLLASATTNSYRVLQRTTSSTLTSFASSITAR